MKYSFVVPALFFIIGCGSNSVKTITDNSSVAGDKLFMPSYAVENLQGTYSGNFDNGFINIELNYINGKTVSGYNLHKGVRRNINGTLQPEENNFHFILKEPGDQPFDGTFDFTIDTTTFLLKGIWKPFDSSKTKSKALSLKLQPKKITAILLTL